MQTHPASFHIPLINSKILSQDRVALSSRVRANGDVARTTRFRALNQIDARRLIARVRLERPRWLWKNTATSLMFCDDPSTPATNSCLAYYAIVFCLHCGKLHSTRILSMLLTPVELDYLYMNYNDIVCMLMWTMDGSVKDVRIGKCRITWCTICTGRLIDW